jgi:hypothetical protein
MAATANLVVQANTDDLVKWADAVQEAAANVAASVEVLRLALVQRPEIKITTSPAGSNWRDNTYRVDL